MKHGTWKKMNRVLSFIMALVMVLSLMPTMALKAEAATPTKLYLKTNSNWNQASARFAAYFFNNSTGKNQWVGMTNVTGETNLYEVSVPSGFPNVIFCRMNPSATANNWNNKWNQTGDLTVPTDGKDQFSVPDGYWDGATTGWSTHAHKYTDKVNAPTCTDQGYTTHTCFCGHTTKDTYTGIIPHNPVDGVCTVCGYAEPTEAPTEAPTEEPTEEPTEDPTEEPT